ncbi:hypothetical protein FEM33_01615 [Dyadobacter flavalbus]|uniref:Uncharacterized protein n=1 Tax=Dyadobacter flavalbus TaxID=2579942 RepID=A0A5M8R1M6_9BACT|nr:hypothetical protein [Dyadobacter flavalbus]KAA6441458.1 hypothetical protein FEM33_01615 [Dyadobacter flavalbus]
MKEFLDDIRADVKKGNYAAASFLILIVIIVFAVPTLWVKIGNQSDKTDAVRAECAKELKEQRKEDQKRLDSTIAAKDIKYDNLNQQFNDFKDEVMVKLERNQQRSEHLDQEGKKVIKAINKEAVKAKQNSKQLDSVSKNLVP